MDSRLSNPCRGPIEALGVGIDIQPGDVVLRCNFATVEDGVVLDRRAGRIREHTDKLAESISGIEVAEGIYAYCKSATEHRDVLVLRRQGLSDQITDSDPKAPNDGKPYLPVQPLEDTLEARRLLLQSTAS